MSNSSSSNTGGIGIAGATFIVFLVLKLTGSITWSWWWVTAPLWGVIAFIVGVVTFAGIVYMGVAALDAVKDRRRE